LKQIASYTENDHAVAKRKHGKHRHKSQSLQAVSEGQTSASDSLMIVIIPASAGKNPGEHYFAVYKSYSVCITWHNPPNVA